MATLTNRAERALLGAMLRDPGLVTELAYVESGDFDLNQHRVLCTALKDAAGTPDGAESWEQAVLAQAGSDVTPDYLEELAAACPDPLHGRCYAALVLEAAFHRAVAEAVEDAAVLGNSVRRDAARLDRAGSAVAFPASMLAADTIHAAVVLQRHVTSFDPGKTCAPAAPPAPDPGDERAKNEETVLAALVGGHSSASRVLDLVRPSAFTDPARRSIFSAAHAAHAAGHALDPLTVDWELARFEGRRRDPALRPVDDEPSYVMRLAGASPAGDEVTRAARVLSSRKPSRTPAPLVQPPPGMHANGQNPGPRR